MEHTAEKGIFDQKPTNAFEWSEHINNSPHSTKHTPTNFNGYIYIHEIHLNSLPQSNTADVESEANSCTYVICVYASSIHTKWFLSRSLYSFYCMDNFPVWKTILPRKIYRYINVWIKNVWVSFVDNFKSVCVHSNLKCKEANILCQIRLAIQRKCI